MLEALRRKKRGCSGFWGLELDFSFQGDYAGSLSLVSQRQAGHIEMEWVETELLGYKNSPAYRLTISTAILTHRVFSISWLRNRKLREGKKLVLGRW